jgi:hypothetical protein
MSLQTPPDGVTPEGMPEVPNIDQHPSFNAEDKVTSVAAGPNDPLMPDTAVPNIDEHPSFNGPTTDGPTGNREDGPLSPEQQATVDETQEADAEPQPAIGIHVVFMEDGQFGIQATGEPNLGEMQMLLSRALKSVESRMIGETVAQVMQQSKSKSRIITPGRS